MTDSESMQDKVQALFPEAKETEIIKLLKDLKRIAPIDLSDSEKIRYLLDIITYTDGLINGDDIEQYTTYKYCTKFAQKALSKVAGEVREQVLDGYRSERAILKNEVASLALEKEKLEEALMSLQAKSGVLQSDVETAHHELEELRSSLEEEKTNGLSKVQESVNIERKKLQDEIAELKSEKSMLSSTVEELKQLITKYNILISKLNNSEEEVTWTPVENDDPIYNTNYRTIESYVKSLKLLYQEKMGVSEEICEKEFEKCCPGLNEFVKIVKSFTNSEITATSSIKAIMEFTRWDSRGQSSASLLKACLKNLRLPKYMSKTTNVDEASLNSDAMPSNMNALLRELHLRRVTTEAIAKQRILEAELKTVIGILQSIAPNYDFAGKMEFYDNLLEEQTEDVSNSQKK